MRVSLCAKSGAATLAVCLLSCGGNEREPRVPISPFGQSVTDWASCPEDLGGASVQCTQAELPLDWSDKESDSTSILLRRVSVLDKARGNLWLLDGGPGFAGDSFLNDTLLELAQQARLDLLIPSHRGSIGESALQCSGQRTDSPQGGRVIAEEWPECRAELEKRWGAGLPAFSARNAALDVAYLIAHSPSAGKTYIFGGSYGALWAHRLLLDTDARPDAVLLDSIVPIGASLERVDHSADRAVEEVLRSCAEVDACARRFDGNPLELSRAAVADLASGSGCAEGRLVVTDVQHLAHGLLNGPPESWVKIASLYERLVRCTPGDADALLRRVAPRPAPGEPEAEHGPALHYNPLLNRHILYRELFRFDRASEERASFEASALALGPDHTSVVEESLAFGADYRKLLTPRRTTSPVPTYLLSGRLDPLDPPRWAEDFQQTLTHGRLLPVPWAGHSTLRYLGWAKGGCGREIFSSFLAGSPDFDCIDQQQAADLGQERTETRRALDAWWSQP